MSGKTIFLATKQSMTKTRIKLDDVCEVFFFFSFVNYKDKYEKQLLKKILSLVKLGFQNGNLFHIGQLDWL